MCRRPGKPTMFLLLGTSFGFSCNFFMVSIFDHVFLQSWRQRSLTELEENRGTIPRPNTSEEVFEVRYRLKEYSKQELDQIRHQNQTKRPRFLDTELGIREKIYVGVLTSPDSIETFGVAVNKTLNHLLPRLAFFMNNQGKVSLPGMSLVSFSDSKSHMIPFHALKYLIDNHLDAYDWFFVFPDTTYIRGNRLLKLVRGISVAENLLIGKPVNVIKGRASSCDLQAGVLISQVIIMSSFITSMATPIEFSSVTKYPTTR